MANITKVLWSSIEDVYNAIINHPFIRGLADGSLRHDAFVYYIAQDHLYLDKYVRALLVLASKMPNINDLQTITRHVLEAIEVERRLHETYMRKWGMSTEGYVESPTNMAYTSFLLYEAYAKPYYEALAAVLPCYWIYAEVGEYLAKFNSPIEDYRLWISTYSGDQYRRAVDEVLKMVDSLTVTEDQLRDMVGAFRTASIYEYLFWDSAYRLEQWPLRLR